MGTVTPPGVRGSRHGRSRCSRAGDLYNPASPLPRQHRPHGRCSRSFLLPRRPGIRGEAVRSWLLVLIPDCSLTAETHDCYLRLGRSWVLPGMLLCAHEKGIFCIMGISRESSPLIRAGSQHLRVVFLLPRQLDSPPSTPAGPSVFPELPSEAVDPVTYFPSTQLKGHLCTKFPTSPLTPQPTPLHTPLQAILRARGRTNPLLLGKLLQSTIDFFNHHWWWRGSDPAGEVP